MGIITFLRDWYDLRRESRGYCKSCDILREQLAREVAEKKELLNKFVFISVSPPAHIESMHEPVLPKTVTWRVQRELLESEDRAKAATIRRTREEAEQASKTTELSIAQLEKELEIGAN